MHRQTTGDRAHQGARPIDRRGVGMIRFRRGVVGVALVALMLASVVTPAVGAKLAGEKVRLGVIMPQAGIFVDWGQHGLIGAEIAKEEINAAGGIGGAPPRPRPGGRAGGPPGSPPPPPPPPPDPPPPAILPAPTA